ncbi:MAG: primosomal protein N' [Bacteroidota bacterium]|nr:primosomal protein N' [Bacteroidota bacterium]
MNKNLYADVILPLPLGNFTYEIPEEFQESVCPGKRVVVQFGKKKFYSALIRNIHDQKPTDFEPKCIEAVLDDTPVILPHQFTFWEWMANYYMCTEGEVFKAALPSGLKLESQSRLFLNEEAPIPAPLPEKEELIYNLLLDQKASTVEELNAIMGTGGALKHIKSLISQGIVVIEEKISSDYKPKSQFFISLADEYCSEEKLRNTFNHLKKAKKQEETLMEFLHLTQFFSANPIKELPRHDLLVKIKGAQGALTGLIKKGILTQFEKNVNRIGPYNGNLNELKPLSSAQQKAFYDTKALFDKHPVVLLHGVTSSGKTEIYIHLIKEYINKGYQVLYLLPEIGLTTQITTRLQTVFGDLTGIYHSKFNDNERVETWNRVLSFAHGDKNSYQLILGARSAVFLPFSNLGLIIVDEEHENSYKQFDPAPRYHARDAAILLAHLSNAKTLLGTATPAIESYYNALTGKYGMVELKTRYREIELPATVIVDTRDAYKRKQMKSHFTPALFEGIQTALNKNEQIILFQNRRGFAPFLQCKNCGWIPKCRHCDVSLTYHKHSGSLNCHYCGYSERIPQKCGHCHSDTLQTIGFGTEKIEEEIKILFPDARVSRMDLDTTRTKRAFENIIADFEQHKIDILVGTQMITKGLDFENVSLVGILNADNMLNFPDFRAAERSFQLIAQVSGRAGRKHGQGKVIIQTASPDHPVLNFVLNNDYQGMFKAQIEERKLFRYPPFFRMIVFNLRHRDQKKVERAAKQFAADLRTVFGQRVLGPEDPVISRMQGYYQKMIWLKTERQVPPSQIKRVINEKIAQLKELSEYSSLIIMADVDPM